MWGDTISSLSESCQIPSEKPLKHLPSKWFFRCISSAFPFRIWGQWKFEEMNLKQLKICCSLRQSSKTTSCFEIAPKSDTQSHTDTRDIWKFHVNIACAQVNPLCSCQSSIAALIVGGRKLAIPQSGSAFSVLSIFIFIIFVILVPISLIFFYFRVSLQEILTEPRRCMSNQSCPIININLFNLFNSFWTDPWSLILDPRSSILDPQSNDPVILDRVFPGKIGIIVDYKIK